MSDLDPPPFDPAAGEPTRIDHPPVVVPAPGGAGPGDPTGPVPGDTKRRPEPEPGGGPSTAAWIVGGLLVLIAIVILALLATRGDDDSDDDVGLEPTTTSTTTTSTTSTTSTTTTSTTTTVPVTTTAPATTTTDPGQPVITADPQQCAQAGADPDEPEPAAQAVFIAWTRGDEACAAELMTPSARVTLFGRDGSQATDVFQGCDEVDVPDPHIDCAFTFEGGATHYLMNFSDTDGWTVFDVTQFAD